jgi:predicted HTH domain antitoxin
MTTRSYPLRIPEGLLKLAEQKSKDEHTDKTTALRQWLYASAEEYALQQLSEGRLTVSQAAEMLDISVYDVQRKAQQRGIVIGATADQYRNALEIARRFSPKRE